MRIQFREMTIATSDVEKTKDFYQKLFQNEAKVEHHDFFYTLKDGRSVGGICVVPHDGDKKWDQAWLCLSTDDLPNAIQYIKDIGVDPSSIENFGEFTEAGSPVTGVTFRDPDGRLLMLLSDDQEVCPR